jgi:hypothetical protein
MKRLPVILLLLATLGFAFGLAHLFRIRFAAGDIYPEYSSLRADPLGTKAFYKSLAALLPTRRNFQPLSKLAEGTDTTLLYLGARPTDLEFTSSEFAHFESFLNTGGRLVIALFPSYQRPFTNRWTATATPTPGRPSPGKQSPPGADDELAHLRPIPITERWGLQFGYAELPRNQDGVYKPAQAARKVAGPLPDSWPCHSALFFDKLNSAWQVIYERRPERPVLIERRFRDGSIVLCADAYPFSNEALREDRQAALLTWLIGPSGHVVFDEVHLGVEEDPGIAALARKYRLHGLFAGLLGLAALFVWMNAAPFVAAPEAEGLQPGVVTGRESAAGFVNLLRRSLPERELLGACLLEWKKTCAHQTSRAKLEQIQAVIDAENAREPGERDLIRTYQAISHIVSRSSEFRVPGSELVRPPKPVSSSASANRS